VTHVVVQQLEDFLSVLLWQYELFSLLQGVQILYFSYQ
jgi:hypothetical protein